ncbi:Tripartite motif-containing protein 16 [Acipenser ruthenus]|uniref:Tripartite motif-containing protein 16 n=1 Tax=Acipenser ruthenus TaxID=7906 RepID=A0A444UCZ4_ACIRT|nr:tripartite motif-containing protein 14 [Acipenser ruthenus]RXM33057.1 Tripartite motif-containing protein 16 [Acipenser ruthenus]
MASMGASLETPACPLCHRPYQERVDLRCGHSFCQVCIQELWSYATAGPRYCPECRDEYKKMPAFSSEDQMHSEAAGPSTTQCQDEYKKTAAFSSADQMHRDVASPNTTQTTTSSVPCDYCSKISQPAVKTCLVCGASMCSHHLKPHLESSVFKSHPLVEPTSDISTWKCMEHQELLKIYCREDGVCVCTVCAVIGAHKQHTCVSVTEAEQELRSNLKDGMLKIKANAQTVQDNLAELREKKLRIQARIDEGKAHVEWQYKALRRHLEVEEREALQRLDREERKTLAGIEAQLEQLEENLQEMQGSAGVLERLSLPREQAFILEYNKMEKSIAVMSSPVAQLESTRELDKDKLERLECWAEKRLETVSNHFETDRDALVLLYGTTPSLNPDSAHPKLVLADGNRTVFFTEKTQPYPQHALRFDTFPQVLSTEPREAGRSYWEVEVKGEGRWKVGVSDPQIGRKGQDDRCRLGYSNLSWTLYGEPGKMEVWHNKSFVPLAPSNPKRVGVYLDYEGGLIAFYSVTGNTITLLHKYQEHFTQPLYPALAASKSSLSFCDLS